DVHGAGDALGVHAAVVLERLVFDRDGGVDEGPGHLVNRDIVVLAIVGVELLIQDVAVAVVNVGGLELDRVDVVNRGQVLGEIRVRPPGDKGHQDHKPNPQRRERPQQAAEYGNRTGNSP